MLRMKYLVTLTLVALLMASGAAFAGPWIALEYVTPLTPTSVPIPVDDGAGWVTVPAFDDVDTDYWAWAQIEECAVTATAAEDFIVQGYGDGSYQPTWQVTRGQMAVFIARAAGYTTGAGVASFEDVPDTYWSFLEIEQCVDAGVVQGYADYFGTDLDAYLPTTVVDRAQMAVYIGRAAFGSTSVVYADAFDDVASDFWAADWIQECVNDNIVQGYGGGIYLPDNTVTRAQMAVFVWRGLVRDDGDVVLGGPAVTDDAAWAPAGDDTGALFYPDVVDTATGANTTDLVAEPGAVVFVVLDAAQVGDGDIVFAVTHDDGGDPPVVTGDGGVTLGVTADAGETAVNVAGVAYLVASYQIDSGLAAEDYTLTLTLPNGNVSTMEFTVAP